MHATITRAPSSGRALPRRASRPVVSIRQIEARDVDGLAAFYAGLSDESRRTRFFCSSRGITAGQARRFATVDHRSADGFVAVVRAAGPDDGRIVGHLCLEPNGDGTDEVGVAVADAFQGQRVGTRLMRAAVASARRRGVASLTASLLCGNVGMRRLLAGAGLPLVERGHDGAVAAFVLPVAPAPVAHRSGPFVPPREALRT